MSDAPHPILALFGPALVLLATSAPAAAGDIVVAARETVAIVTPGEAHRELVNLPALEFALRAAFRCSGAPVSITLSVADTHTTLQKDQLEGQRAAEANLQVPTRQLALAASSRFCIADDAGSADELLVPGFATAHASLRCSGNGGDSAHSASAPLKVRLVCAREAGADQESPSAAE